MIDEDLLEEQLKPFRKKEAKIASFVRKFFKKETDYIDFPKFTFLNGYHYGMVRHKKIKDVEEYMDGIFLKMSKERVFCYKTRTSKGRLEIFVNSPKEEEMDTSKCFAAGLSMYFNKMLKEAQAESV